MLKSSTANILFTSIYNKVSLINSFHQAYRNLKIKGRIIAVDINPFSAGLQVADRGYLVPRLDDKKFLPKALEICRQEKIKLIIPTRDEDLLYFSRIQDRLDKLNIKILVSPAESIIICQNKWKFYQFLKQNNFPLIKTWQRYNQRINFPCLVKPRIGKAARGLVAIKNKSELNKVNLKDKIIQEKIKGEEYTIDYFADFKAQPICLVPRLRYKVVDGESKVSITKKEPEMIEWSKELGKKLKLIGHNTIQCFKTSAGQIKFLEINPRFGGGASLSFAAGCKSPEWILRLLWGEKIAAVDKVNSNLVMIRYNTDIFVPYDKIDNF